MRYDHAIGVLKNLFLFRELNDDLMEKIALRVRVIHASKHEVLYKKGDICDGFFIVFYGRVRLSIFTKKGIEKPIQIAGPGNSFGEATMFQQVLHYTTAIVLEDSRLIFIPQAVIIELLKSDWRASMRMLANLSYRVHLLVNDIDDFGMRAAPARLARYLLRLVPPGCNEVKNVQFSLKKNLLAAQLHMTPETLSRYFLYFCNRGLISLNGNRVSIFDRESLSAYSDEENGSST